MNTSVKISDSITLQDNYLTNSQGAITTILQNSIRYEKFKKFAVYHGQLYIGNYECCSKKVMKYSEITDMMSIMFFTEIKKYAASKIKGLFRKGRWSENSDYAMIVLVKMGYSSEFVIKRHEDENGI